MKAGKPAGTNAEYFHARRFEPKHRHGGTGNDQSDKRTGKPPVDPWHKHNDGKRPGGDSERWKMHLPKVPNDLEQPRNDAALMNWKSEDLAGLPENDRQGYAVEKSDENGLREEIRQSTQPQETRCDADQAGERGERSRQRGIGRSIPASQRSHRCRHNSAGRRIRADNELARAAEQRIGDERQNARIKSDLWRKSREFRVGDRDRNGDGGDGESGANIR